MGEPEVNDDYDDGNLDKADAERSITLIFGMYKLILTILDKFLSKTTKPHPSNSPH